MEIKFRDRNLLILEHRSLTSGVISMALLICGIILPLATMKEYGLQSWYRFTWWIGPILIILGLVVFRIMRQYSKVIFDRKKGEFWLEWKNGWQAGRSKTWPMESISDIRIEQSEKGISARNQYRIAVRLSEQEWIPLTPSYDADLHNAKQQSSWVSTFINPTSSK